jgi:hypothetical protein
MDIDDVIDRLNDLIQLDVDAVLTSRLPSAATRPSSNRRSGSSKRTTSRHITDLSREVTSMGGSPKVKRDVKAS